MARGNARPSPATRPEIRAPRPARERGGGLGAIAHPAGPSGVSPAADRPVSRRTAAQIAAEAAAEIAARAAAAPGCRPPPCRDCDRRGSPPPPARRCQSPGPSPRRTPRRCRGRRCSGWSAPPRRASRTRSGVLRDARPEPGAFHRTAADIEAVPRWSRLGSCTQAVETEEARPARWTAQGQGESMERYRDTGASAGSGQKPSGDAGSRDPSAVSVRPRSRKPLQHSVLRHLHPIG